MANPSGPGPPATRGSPQRQCHEQLLRHRRVLHHHPRVRPHARPEARPRDHAQRRARPGVRQPRVLGDDLPDVHRLAVRSDRKGSRRLVAAELHDVRHLGAAVDVRGEFQPAREGRHLSLARNVRPADDQQRAGAQHRPQLHRQDLLDRVDAGRRSDLRPQRLRPGPGRRPQARPLADLLQRPARRPQPRRRVGRSSRPRATSTTRCSITATSGRPSPTSPPASATTR